MKVDYYLFETTSSQKAWYFACHVIEEFYTTHKKSIYIHTATREDAERFDALLWTYRDNSFLPHHLYKEDLSIGVENPVPLIEIGFANPTHNSSAILFNLTPHIPTFYKQYHHVIEIVFNDPLVQQLARERYKQYREQQCELNTIKYKADDT